MSRKPITISLEKKTIRKIDATKSKNEPRSRFIEDILSEYLIKKNAKNSHQNSQPKQSSNPVRIGDAS